MADGHVRSFMARQHGIAGGTLKGNLVGILLLVVAVGFFAFLAIRWIAPSLAPLAPLLGVFAAVALLRDRKIEMAIVAQARGAIGESRVGSALARLPSGWRVFHDVMLETENVDHVVVSNRGVFSIEAKNYSGGIRVEPTGVFTHGKRNDEIVRQAWRQAHRLRELLGVEVEPVLVVNGRSFGAQKVGRLDVMGADALVPFLLGHDVRRLDLAEGRRVMELLADRCVGGPK